MEYAQLAAVVGMLGFAKKLATQLLDKSEGSVEMQRIGTFIRQGAEGFLRTQYNAIARITMLVSVFIFVLNWFLASDVSLFSLIFIFLPWSQVF